MASYRLYRLLIMIFIFKIFFWNTLHAESRSPSLDPPPFQQSSSGSKIFFSFTIGVGFLYFDRISGNLSPYPPSLFTNFSGANFGSPGSPGYNRTPLFEGMIGYQAFDFLSGSLSFQTQSGISVSSTPNRSTSSGRPVTAEFSSDLQLNAIMLKAFLSPPVSLFRGRISPYLGAGIGAGWQSWTNVSLYETAIVSGTFSPVYLSLRQKIAANVVWGADAGIRFSPGPSDSGMSIRLGCKYNDWGKSGNIGLLSDQPGKTGPFQPIHIRKVYSFAPYLGVQWNF